MSGNQSKSDKSSESHLRNNKPTRSGSFGRNNNVTPGSGGGGRGGGGGGGGPSAVPPPSSTNHSFKKAASGNGQGQGGGGGGGQNSRVNVSNVTNGAHPQTVLPGGSAAAAAAVPRNNNTRAPPRAPVPVPSQTAAKVSDGVAEKLPPPKGDMGFPLQFGSINVGAMKSVQIPARTSSAPPNLDEQKQDQARHSSFRPAPAPAPALPIPSISKQQQPKKDAGNINQSNVINSHSPPQVKRDVHVSQATTQKPFNFPGVGMAMPNPYPAQVPISFGGPKVQISSQGVPPVSHHMPMPVPLPVGNTSQVQQPVFVSGLQPHPLQPQGMMPQGHGLNFGPHPMAPPMGNMIGISQQYQHQQPGKFVGTPRKTAVKITHPDTHEELRLSKRSDTNLDGGSSGSRSHPNVTPQSQPIAYSPPFYSPMQHGYNNPPIYYQSPAGVPLTGPQITAPSQPSRFNYPHVSHNLSFINSSVSSQSSIIKTGVPNAGVAEPPKDSRPFEGSSQVTVKPAFSSVVDRIGSPLVTVSSPVVSKGELPVISTPSKEASAFHSGREGDIGAGNSVASKIISASSSVIDTTQQSITEPVTVSKLLSPCVTSLPYTPCEESGSAETNSEERRESFKRSDSSKDPQKKHDKNDIQQIQLLHQKDESVSSRSSSSNASREVGQYEDNTAILASVRVGLLTSFSTVTKEKSSAASKGDSGCASSVASVKPVSAKYAGTPESVSDTSSKISSNEFVEVTEQQRKDLSTMEVPDKDEQSEINASVKVYSEPHLETNESSLDSVEKTANNTMTSLSSGSIDAEAPHTAIGADNVTSAGRDEHEIVLVKPGTSAQDLDCTPTELPLDSASELEAKDTGPANGDPDSVSVSSFRDKHILEPNRSKGSTVAKGKKKMKDILRAADAAGSISDLYNAYKDPGEKQEILTPSEVEDSSVSIDATSKNVESTESVNSKNEPDNWEDAADASTPNLKASLGEDISGVMCKKYSRDFLLTLSEQCIMLPVAFEIPAEVAESLLSVQVGNSHLMDLDQYSNSGRSVDRAGGGPRRGNAMIDDGKWNRTTGPYGQGRDPRQDSFHGGVGVGRSRPGQGGNHGVLRSPQGQSSGQYVGGILSGPLTAQGIGMQRNSLDADRWVRNPAGAQRGLMPSPQTPLQQMHKALSKYEVGKVSDEEQAKQRQLKGILNKLTPQNFEKLFEQVKEVNIDNAVTLTGVISQIFDKALMEPTFCEMYANFCFHLSAVLPDFSEDNEKITFKRLLLNKCQEEFERGVREQEEANRVDDGGEIKCTEEEREEKKTKARRRMLGNIRLIGELYKKKMLTERIMHECIKKLLGQFQNPDEEDIEALCKLMSTIGEMIDHAKAREHMDAYFDMMLKLSNNMALSSRLRFMLKDSIDLRKNKWQQRRKVEGPKKIDEVHRDAAHEKQVQASRLARGPTMSSSARRGPPALDFAPRASSNMPSPGSYMGSGLRGLPTPGRGGYSNMQDVRMEERHPYENRMLSVPLSQRPSDDNSITLGPQGGLARGMSIRGQPPMQGAPLVDMSLSPAESRRSVAGSNGFRSAPDWMYNSPREEVGVRYATDRVTSSPVIDQVNSLDRRTQYGNRDVRSLDRSMDRSFVISPVTRTQGSSVAALPAAIASDKVLAEEDLRDMSIAAIREFYSAKDEGEVALCIRELNSPAFYASMVSLWVTDSFERKDMERDLLAKLLVNLVKSQDSLLNRIQLVKGVESVLSTLEDAVNDAPRAAEFLGRILAKVIAENVVPLKDIGRLVHEGGENPGSLVEVGLAAEVLGTIFEVIRLEKGETVLNEIQKSSNLRVEDFRPPAPIKWRKLEAFV